MQNDIDHDPTGVPRSSKTATPPLGPPYDPTHVPTVQGLLEIKDTRRP